MKSIGKRNLHMAVSRTIGSLVAGAFCMVSGLAGAQGYPSKLIKIVVPWAAGGVTDVAARAMARGLSDRMSVPVVVENKSGAAGTIGARFVASAPADGYTLLLASSETQTIAPNLRAKLSYAPQKDFVPIMPFAIVPFALVARRDFPASTVDQLIALIKKSPGKFTYASPGVGSTSQLAMETLKHLTGMDILHIPFQGQAPAMTALIGGQIDLEMLAAGQAQTSLQSGRLKVLAVTTQERVVGMPDVPTFKEAGVPSLSFSNWYGLVAPAGLPPPILQRLATEMAAVMKSADMKAALKNLGLKDIDPPMPPPEFKQFLASEMIRWGSVIHSADIKLE